MRREISSRRTYIGTAPGGGYRLRQRRAGNGGDGVFIDDAPDNQIGGTVNGDGNVISSNQGNGVNITGCRRDGNTVPNNIIGLTSGGSAGPGQQPGRAWPTPRPEP